jgi:hypothetical protein
LQLISLSLGNDEHRQRGRMLKRLARMSGRRVVALWLLLLLAEGGFILVGQIAERRRVRQEMLGPELTSRPGPALSRAASDSLVAIFLASTRPVDSAREAQRNHVLSALARRSPPVSAAERDSLWQLLDVPTTLSAAQRDSAMRQLDQIIGPLFQGIGKIFEDPRWRWMLFGAMALFYGPPVLLLTVTLMWLVARYRLGSSTLGAPVA